MTNLLCLLPNTAISVSVWAPHGCGGYYERERWCYNPYRIGYDMTGSAADELRKTLEFYVDEENYLDGAVGEWVTYSGHPGSYTGFDETEFEADNGERAKYALQ